jgi:hypothetical protein
MGNEDLQTGIRGNLNTFLSEYPLYRRLEVYTIYAELDERDISFNAFCETDNRITTFKIIKTVGASNLKDELKRAALSLASNSTFDYKFVIHCPALCQDCQQFQREFFIYGNTSRAKNEEMKFFIKKIGQYPAPEVTPDKIFKDFLSREDIEYYKKAKQILNFNFGIGAFAYFRRIVENEILNITKYLIDNNQTAKEKLVPALNLFKKNHRMTGLIETLTPFLPKNFLLANENPLNLLYASISDGIHNLTEEECTQRSIYIEKLLRHVIIELRNQESRNDANDALNNLKKF